MALVTRAVVGGTSKIRWKPPEECPGRQNVELVGGSVKTEGVYR